MFGLQSTFGGIMTSVKGLIGAFKLDPEKGKEFEVQMVQALIQQRDSEIEADDPPGAPGEGAHPRRGAYPGIDVHQGRAADGGLLRPVRNLHELHSYSLPAMGFRE